MSLKVRNGLQKRLFNLLSHHPQKSNTNQYIRSISNIFSQRNDVKQMYTVTRNMGVFGSSQQRPKASKPPASCVCYYGQFLRYLFEASRAKTLWPCTSIWPAKKLPSKPHNSYFIPYIDCCLWICAIFPHLFKKENIDCGYVFVSSHLWIVEKTRPKIEEELTLLSLNIHNVLVSSSNTELAMKKVAALDFRFLKMWPKIEKQFLVIFVRDPVIHNICQYLKKKPVLILVCVWRKSAKTVFHTFRPMRKSPHCSLIQGGSSR